MKLLTMKFLPPLPILPPPPPPVQMFPTASHSFPFEFITYAKQEAKASFTYFIIYIRKHRREEK
jgi:hypothetical protein